MNVLALDTATRASAVALRDDHGLELEARDDPPVNARPRHNTRLMGLIVELLDRAGSGWETVDRIAVGVGPGTFTGLRIGIATARALAGAREVGLVGVSTLQSLALGGLAAEGRDGDVLAVLDARRSEVFVAGWHRDATSEPFLAPVASRPEDLAEVIRRRGSSPLAIGEGALAFRSVLELAGAVVPDDHSSLHRVTALNHCRLATGMRARAPNEVHPEYLRLPDAEIARRATRTE